MPFDGSGNYTPPGAPNFPAVTGTTVVSSYYNNVINDLAAALSLCFTRDGQTKPSTNIDWNAKDLINAKNITAQNFSLTGSISTVTNITATGTITANVVATSTLTTTTPISSQYGGTGIDGHLAANGSLLIGNGAGFSLATLTAGANITITNAAGTITIAASGGAGGGSTSFSLTFDNSGAGAASGATFNGAVAKTISYNSIGAAPAVPGIQTVTGASITPTFINDGCVITANAPFTFNAPTGTAIEMWGMVMRIKDDGTARGLTFNAIYRAIGTVALPTTTVVGKWTYIVTVYNNVDTKWDILAVYQQ